MRHETPADLSAEAEIAAKVRAATGLSATPKLPVHYVLDVAAIRDDGITGFFEIKDRDWTFGDGDGCYLSMFKVLSAELIERATGVPCFLAARFNDGVVRWCSLRAWDRERGVFWFGRGERDRDEDEPCVRFRWSVFKEVK